MWPFKFLFTFRTFHTLQPESRGVTMIWTLIWDWLLSTTRLKCGLRESALLQNLNFQVKLHNRMKTYVACRYLLSDLDENSIWRSTCCSIQNCCSISRNVCCKSSWQVMKLSVFFSGTNLRQKYTKCTLLYNLCTHWCTPYAHFILILAPMTPKSDTRMYTIVSLKIWKTIKSSDNHVVWQDCESK